jgi:membrane protein implicated in regulation of membrane protease activity
VDAWLVWLIVAAVLAGVETLSGDLILAMLAGGAAAGAATQAATGSFPAAVVVAAVVAVLLLFGVRPYARRRLMAGDGGRFGVDRIMGSPALVVEPVDDHDGRVRVQGAEWSARSAVPGHRYPRDASLFVVGIDGATALVWADLETFPTVDRPVEQ